MSFIRSYVGHLVGLITGGTLSAAVLVYGLLTGKNAPVWIGFVVCVLFVIGAALRMKKESSRNYTELQDRMLGERAKFIEVIKGRDNQLQRATERIAELEQTQLEDGPFVRVEWILSADGLSNFFYHNIGNRPAWQAALLSELAGQPIRCRPDNVEPGQRKPIIVRQSGTSPDITLNQCLLNFHDSHGAKSIEQWVTGGHYTMTLPVEIRFYDQEGGLFATDWEINRNFLRQPDTTSILPVGPKRAL